jgi:hypothetical protein
MCTCDVKGCIAPATKSLASLLDVGGMLLPALNPVFDAQDGEAEAQCAGTQPRTARSSWVDSEARTRCPNR